MVSTESQAAMDAAKQAVIDFMGRNGRHNTTVHEKVAPAIYHETITRIEHEDLVTVIDREVTQDHYHTSVQPITDNETLEEQHHHNELPVEDRTFHQDDQEETHARLAAERDKFRDEVQRVDGERTQTIVPTLNAEHIHHHVHEIIQPVVNKHVIEPHVIHTTVFIRELHHNAAKHHTLSALPAVTMAEFTRQGGVLSGREERWDRFDGEPRAVGGNTGASSASGSNTAGEPSFSQVLLPPAPERRSTLAANERQAAPAPQAAAGSHDNLPTQPTPSAQAVTEARKLGEGQAAPAPASSESQQQQPQAQPQQPQAQTQAQPSSSSGRGGQQQPQQGQAAGRWSLLPMHLAGSAGEGQPGHPASSRGPSRLPQASQSEGRQGSVARSRDQQQQQQDQQPRRGS